MERLLPEKYYEDLPEILFLDSYNKPPSAKTIKDRKLDILSDGIKENKNLFEHVVVDYSPTIVKRAYNKEKINIIGPGGGCEVLLIEIKQKSLIEVHTSKKDENIKTWSDSIIYYPEFARFTGLDIYADEIKIWFLVLPELRGLGNIPLFTTYIHENGREEPYCFYEGILHKIDDEGKLLSRIIDNTRKYNRLKDGYEIDERYGDVEKESIEKLIKGGDLKRR